MEISNCPECGEDTINTGLAFWPEIDEPVTIVGCSDADCGWVGVEAEWRQTLSTGRVVSAA